jgi:tetratricopeptide (TPR) repeat protein
VIGAREIAERGEAHRAQALGCLRSDAPHALDWQWIEKRGDVFGGNDHEPVRLLQIARDLGEELVGSDAGRGGQSRLLADRRADALGDRAAVAEEAAARGDVEKRFVDREPFDERREAAEDREDLFADLFVAPSVRRDDDRVRHQAQRLRHRHCRARTERARFVRSSGDDTAPFRSTDEHRPSAQRRIVELLDRRKERVHVDVQNLAHGRQHTLDHDARVSAMNAAMMIALGLWGLVAGSVIVRLSRRGAAAFDDRFELDDRRLVGALAFYLIMPLVVLLSQLAQIALLVLLGGRLGRFETYVVWGAIEVDPAFAPWARATIAALGPSLLLLVAGSLLAWTRYRPGNAAGNHLRLECARLLLLVALGVAPIASLVLSRGDAWMLRGALNELHPQIGELTLLCYGIFGAWVFWRWRNARRLRVLASAVHDAMRYAQARLALRADDVEALRALGAAQLAAGDIGSAIALLEQAQKLDPNDPRTELLLGRAHLWRGHPQAASERLRHAGELIEQSDEATPLMLEVTLALSAARIAIGDAEGAILTAEAALEQAPADPRGFLLYVDALVAGGRLDEARRRLHAAHGDATGTLRIEIERRLRALRRV